MNTTNLCGDDDDDDDDTEGTK